MGNCFSSPGGTSGDRGKGGGNSRELRNYDPVRYLSDRAVIRDPNRTVICVHFVAHTLLQNGGNHWTIYLQTSPKDSVRINMEPGELRGAPAPGHGYRGEMQLTHRNHNVTRNRQFYVTIPAFPGHPVAHFIDAIINAGNHEYDFTTEGRGCTGWILDQYRLFSQSALIRPGFDAIENAINLQWVRGQPTSEWPATRGFYMREPRGGGWGARRGGSGSGSGSGSRARQTHRR